MKHEILSWAFGFFTIPAIAGCIGLLIGWLCFWFSLPEDIKWISLDKAWAGGWLFVALCILGGVITWRVVG
jgi:hypothetical protein